MGTVVVDTISALVAAATAAPGLATVTVVDGPTLGDASITDRLYIGAEVDPLSPGAEGENAPEFLPGVVDVEDFSIGCVAEAWSGDTGIDTLVDRRVRCFAMRDVVRGLIAPAASGAILGGVALSHANIGRWQLVQTQTGKGLYVGLSFRVECIARPVTS